MKKVQKEADKQVKAKQEALVCLNRGKAKVAAVEGKDYAIVYSARLSALPDFIRAIQLDSTCAEAYAYRAICDNGQNKVKNVEDYSTAIRLKPDYAEAYFLRGETIAYLGLKSSRKEWNYSGAIPDYEAASRYAPNVKKYHEKRLFTRSQLKDFTGIVKDWEIIEKLDPTSECYCYIIMALNGLGEFRRALEYVILDWSKIHANWSTYSKSIQDRWLANKQTALHGLINNLQQRFKLQQYVELILDCDVWIKVEPGNETAYLNRGTARILLKKYKEAINDFNEFIRLKSDDPLAFYNRGIAHNELGHYQQALDDYQRALALSPGDQRFITQVATLKKHFSELNQAEQKKRAAEQERIRQSERQAAELQARAAQEESKRQLERERSQREEELRKREEDAKAKKQQEERSHQTQLEQQLANLKLTTKAGRQPLSALCQSWENPGLEQAAILSRNADFFASRGGFYYDAAKKETSEIRRAALHDKALSNYQRAIEFNPFVDDAAERVEEIISTNQKKASPGTSLSRPPVTMLFANPSSMTQQPPLSRAALTPEQLRELERVKNEMRSQLPR